MKTKILLVYKDKKLPTEIQGYKLYSKTFYTNSITVQFQKNSSPDI